jgi:hypothetical protein
MVNGVPGAIYAPRKEPAWPPPISPHGHGWYPGRCVTNPENNVAVGKYTSDLERGDVLGPVEYTLSPFVVREYCHAVELHQDCFQGTKDQIMPPTLIHLDKLRLYRHACPLGTGPHARVHIEYDATFHEAVHVGDRLRVGGTVSDRYEKRGRDYVHIDMELYRVSDNTLLVSYRDTVILSYKGANA